MAAVTASTLALAIAALQPLVAVSLPALLALGFVVGLVLLVLGLLEMKKGKRRAHLIAGGTTLLGVMSVVTPLTWYGYWAFLGGVVVMGLGDLLIVALLALFGGLLIAFGIQSARTRG